MINVSGEATYIMVLKDENGIVKLYALVNVENFSIVATGATQREAMTAYRNQLAAAGGGSVGEEKTATVTVTHREIVTMSDGPTVYLTAEDGAVYKGYLETDEALIRVQLGDRVQLSYAETGIEGLYRILGWSFVTE